VRYLIQYARIRNDLPEITIPLKLFLMVSLFCLRFNCLICFFSVTISVSSCDSIIIIAVVKTRTKFFQNAVVEMENNYFIFALDERRQS